MENNTETIALVEFLSAASCQDESVIRRAIVEGRVTVDGAVVDDPAYRLGDMFAAVGYKNKLYPFYP